MARPKINIIEITHYIHHDPVIDPETGEIIVPAWDEPVYEAVTREMNDEEYAEYESSQNTPEATQMEIESLKSQLASTDYIACKIAEGSATREEYADIIAERQSIRQQINQLEGVNG